MRILVTGSNGYIGTHILRKLSESSNEIYTIDTINEKSNNNSIKIDVDMFNGDKNIFKLLGCPDLMIHLAWKDGFNHNAFSHIENLPKHVEFIQNMINGGLKHLVVLGTMHEVGYWEGSITEKTPCNPKTYYGIAKNSLRQVIESFIIDKPIVFQWIRAFYITGDDINSNSIFGKLLRASNDGKKSFPLNSGVNLYDFIDIDELANQVILTSMQSEVQGIINCCSGEPISLKEKIKQFIKDNKLDIDLEFGTFPNRAYDSPGVWGDTTKINKIVAKEIGEKDV